MAERILCMKIIASQQTEQNVIAADELSYWLLFEAGGTETGFALTNSCVGIARSSDNKICHTSIQYNWFSFPPLKLDIPTTLVH